MIAKLYHIAGRQLVCPMRHQQPRRGLAAHVDARRKRQELWGEIGVHNGYSGKKHDRSLSDIKHDDVYVVSRTKVQCYTTIFSAGATEKSLHVYDRTKWITKNTPSYLPHLSNGCSPWAWWIRSYHLFNLLIWSLGRGILNAFC